MIRLFWFGFGEGWGGLTMRQIAVGVVMEQILGGLLGGRIGRF